VKISSQFISPLFG